MEFRQFKLTNGDEIVCEVYKWEDEILLVRKALMIVSKDDAESQMRYYTFKPWIMMATNMEEIHFLSKSQIISESTPSNVALQYYDDIIFEMESDPDDDLELLSADEYETDSAEHDSILH